MVGQLGLSFSSKKLTKKGNGQKGQIKDLNYYCYNIVFVIIMSVPVIYKTLKIGKNKRHADIWGISVKSKQDIPINQPIN